jgi:ubiquinone/menaquinone biosynthesis C-methylase UbiE
MTNPISAAWKHAGAHIYDPFLALGERRGMRELRRNLVGETRGHVLEIGAGTGLNVPFYPADVERLVLTEPERGMARRLERRVARLRPDAEVVMAGAEALPFPDMSFDTVVSTLVLCTVPDPHAAVEEIQRVLRPAGQLLFIEHLRAEDEALARWQERLAGAWQAFAAGCHCDRRTLDLIDDAFKLGATTRSEWRGMPAIVRPLVRGAAARPAR